MQRQLRENLIKAIAKHYNRMVPQTEKFLSHVSIPDLERIHFQAVFGKSWEEIVAEYRID